MCIAQDRRQKSPKAIPLIPAVSKANHVSNVPSFHINSKQAMQRTESYDTNSTTLSKESHTSGAQNSANFVEDSKLGKGEKDLDFDAPGFAFLDIPVGGIIRLPRDRHAESLDHPAKTCLEIASRMFHLSHDEETSETSEFDSKAHALLGGYRTPPVDVDRFQLAYPPATPQPFKVIHSEFQQIPENLLLPIFQ